MRNLVHLDLFLALCDPGWTYDRNGDACYVYVSDYYNWHNAEANCVNMNGHLASINSFEESQFLTRRNALASRKTSHSHAIILRIQRRAHLVWRF